jgi:cytochrome P450
VAEAVSNPHVDALLAELANPVGREDPYPRYHELRNSAPVARAEDGVLVLTRYTDCHELLRDPQFGHGDTTTGLDAVFPEWRDHLAIYLLRTSLLSLDPPAHARLRRLLGRTFTARRVAGLRPAVEALTAQLLDQMVVDSDFVDFIDTFAFPLPNSVIGELLGVPAEDRPQFQDLVRDWTLILDAYTPEILANADAAAGKIRDYLRDLAAERTRQPRDDLMSALVQPDANGDTMTHDELMATATLLFSAGFETTTHLLGNGLVALLRSPEQIGLLTGDPERVPRAVEELLRFDSPVQLTGRNALQDTVIAGVEVPRGQRVIAYLGAANRDPAHAPEPDRLDLTRSGAALMSFGGGIHYCLGAPLARLEAQIAFPAVFERFPAIRLAEPLERRNSLTLRGYLKLPVILT